MFAGVDVVQEFHIADEKSGDDSKVSEIETTLIDHDGNCEENSSKQLEKIENEKKSKTTKKVEKDKWGNDIEFLMSCIALSVGLGNVWRFPFTALENGGGCFVLIYIIILLLVGKPLYMMELVLGQFSSRGCIKVYDMSPAMRGIGIGQVLSTCLVTTYYASLMALTIRYFLASFNDPLPWTICRDEWNVSCVSSSIKSHTNHENRSQSSAELYFLKDIIREAETIDNGIGTPNWQLCLCLIFAWICISGILIKGVKTSGKASYFLAAFPYFVMFILLVRSATLEGAYDGMIFFITPDWSKVFEARVWYAAVTQVFYSLAVCFGSIIMYSSYNRFDHKINVDVHVITILDTFTSLLAGCTIFGILGHLAWVMNVPVKEVTKSSVALAFMAYPETISKIDFIPQFFAMLFFIMLFVLGIGSNIGMTSCIMTVIRDRFPQVPCWKIALGIAFVGVTVGMVYTTPGGMFLINFLDFYGASFVALILAIIEILTVTWIYGVDRLCLDIEFMLNMKVGLYWRICWRFVTPSIMIAVLGYFIYTWESLTYQNIEYPTGMHIFGWFLSVFILIQLPIWAFIAIRDQKEKSIWKKIVRAYKPNENWGPSDFDKNEEYKEFISCQLVKNRKDKLSIWERIKKFTKFFHTRQ